MQFWNIGLKGLKYWLGSDIEVEKEIIIKLLQKIFFNLWKVLLFKPEFVHWFCVLFATEDVIHVCYVNCILVLCSILVMCPGR